MLVLLLITIVSFSCPVAEEMQFHLRRTGESWILLQVVLFSYRFLGKATNDSATALGPATCRQFAGMLLGHSGFPFGFLVWLGLRIVETLKSPLCPFEAEPMARVSNLRELGERSSLSWPTILIEPQCIARSQGCNLVERNSVCKSILRLHEISCGTCLS